MHKIISFFAKYWPILLIVLISFLLRLVKLEQLFYFTYDESVPAFVGRRLVLWQHLPLIGGVTPFGFHLGPYFYWLLAFILWLGKLNPIAWGWTAAFIASITSFLIYIVGLTFGDKKIGITAAIFWSFSYLANVYDRHFWALYWGPLISLITLISLHKIIKGQEKFVYILALTLALGLSFDPSNFVFVLLTIIAWIIYRIPFKRSTLIATSIFVFSFLPLVIFDLRHNFANAKPFISFWQQGKNVPGFETQKFIDNSLIFPRAFTRLIYTFGDNEIAKQYSYCQNFVQEKYEKIFWFFVFLSMAAILIFTILGLKNRQNNIIWFLSSILFILYFLGIQIYGTVFKADIFEHYITGTFAIFLLVAAFVASLLPRKLWLIVLGLFVAFNLYKLLNVQNSMGLLYKRQAIEFTMREVGDKSFSFDSLSTCWKYSGYRYLFTVFGKEPVKSYVDPNFAYLYGATPVAEKHPQTVVSFVIHDFKPETDEFYKRYAILKSHEIKSSLFGRIEVIIVDNASGWFDKN